MNKISSLFIAILLCTVATLSQSVSAQAPPQKITFANIAAGFHTGSFVSYISAYNDGDTVNDSDIPQSDSWINYSPGYPTIIGVWMPDVFPGNSLSCSVDSNNTTVVGAFPNPQVVTFTANCSTYFLEAGVYQKVAYTLVTVQNRHYVRVACSGRSGGRICYGGPWWDGGTGTLTLVTPQ
jgi:hypothetical protein